MTLKDEAINALEHFSKIEKYVAKLEQENSDLKVKISRKEKDEIAYYERLKQIPTKEHIVEVLKKHLKRETEEPIFINTDKVFELWITNIEAIATEILSKDTGGGE